MKREKVFRTIKRVMAILGIILIVLMYAATFIAAVFVKKYTVRLFLASMIMTMVVPLLLYAPQRVINRKAAVNFSAFERSGSGIAVGQSKGLCRGSRYKSSSFFTVKIITISDDIMTMTLNAFFLAANCVIIIAAHNFSAQ